MIRREDVADLQPGDVIELVHTKYPDVLMRGTLHEKNGRLRLGHQIIREASGDVRRYSLTDCDLIVVSRAPRSLYVNHPRTEPVPGDVVRDADGVVWLHDSWKTWHSPDSTCAEEYQDTGLAQPLRLLVDGETGQVVQ